MAPIKKVASKPKKSSKRIAANEKEQKKKKAAELRKAAAAKKAEELVTEREKLMKNIEELAEKEKSMEEEIKERNKTWGIDKKKKALLDERYHVAMSSWMAHVRKETAEAREQPVLPMPVPDPMLCNLCKKAYCDKKDESGTTPRVLDCGHTMCERCIREHIAEGSVVCPMDETAQTIGPNGVEQFRKNFCVMAMFG